MKDFLGSFSGRDSKLSMAAAGTVLANVGGAAGRFLLQIVIEQYLGVAAYGRFVTLRGWGEMLATLPNRGYHGAMVRFLPEYETTEQWAFYRGLRRRSLNLTIFGALAIAVVAAVVGLVILDDGSTAILIAAASIPAWATMRMLQLVLQAQHQFVATSTVTQLIQPVLTGVGLLFIWLTHFKLDLESALGILLISIVLSIGIQVYLTRISTPVEAATTPGFAYERDQWNATAYGLYGSQLAIAVIGMADILILAMFVEPAQVALYSIASRIAILGRMVNSGLESIVSPRISASWAKRSIEGIQRSVENSIALSTIPTVLIAIFLTIFRGPVLGLVGEEFREAGGVLVLLLIGNVINALTGPSGYVVSLTDNEQVYTRIMMGTAVGLVIGCFIVSPLWGIIGVALVRTVSNIAWNGALVLFAKRRLGVRCYPTLSLIRRSLRFGR